MNEDPERGFPATHYSLVHERRTRTQSPGNPPFYSLLSIPGTMNREPGTKNQEPDRPARMSEAEVSLRLAFWLISEKLVSDNENQVLGSGDTLPISTPREAVFDTECDEFGVKDQSSPKHWG